MIILLHSSKTMKPQLLGKDASSPILLSKAKKLGQYLKTLSQEEIEKSMKLSSIMAKKTYDLIQDWSVDPAKLSTAIDCFKGDIYSGLQAQNLDPSDREYAQKTLFILSGLYGVIKPLDGIAPYRVEMAYKFPDSPYDNLYKFWGHDIADSLPKSEVIVNVSSVEYTKTVLPYLDSSKVVTPQFFTISPKTGQPTFVTVHSKIARGAFARWLITTRTDSAKDLGKFDLLGYKYDVGLSKPGMPAFITKEFGGIGLSVRLK